MPDPLGSAEHFLSKAYAFVATSEGSPCYGLKGDLVLSQILHQALNAT